jgi:hypothetical protein
MKLKTSGTARYSILWRNIIHKPITAIFSRALSRKIKLIRNDYDENGKPTVFAVTHVFYDDLAVVCCCLKRAAYILNGIEGPNNTPSLAEYIALWLNGVILVNRSDKHSRAKAFDTVVEVLNRGGDVFICPESAWNFSPNVMICKLNWGAVKAAIQTEANIVPVAVDTVDDCYCVIIGDIFDYTKYNDLHQVVEELRSEMATLAWELISMKQPVKRKSLTDAYWLDHIKAQYVCMPLKDQSKEETYMYRPKGETNLGELLADMYGIEHKSMAVDYEAYRRVERLIDNWTKPIRYSCGERERR